MAAPSAQENALILKFREKLSDLNLNDERQSDMYLVRFLRARDLNLSKAEDMFRKHITWIIDNDMDKIMLWEPPKFFHDECPYELSGFGREGQPVFIAPFGIWDVRKICEMKEKANYVRYVDQLFMKVLRSMSLSTDNNNTPITQFIAVFLPDNLQAFRQMSSIQAVDAVLETVRRFEANHPERLKAAFIVDAPRAFSIIFSAIKPLLNSRTLGKVTIATNESDWKPKLFELVDPSQVPKRLGGTAISSISFFNEEKGGVLKYLSEKRIAGQNELIDDFLQVKIEAGKKFKLDYDVEEPGSTIAWSFKTDGYDIGYSVLFEDKNEIIPYERVETQKEPQTGTVLCKNCGKYTIIFDNTYSRMRSKVLQYKVSLLETINSFEDQYQATIL